MEPTEIEPFVDCYLHPGGGGFDAHENFIASGLSHRGQHVPAHGVETGMTFPYQRGKMLLDFTAQLVDIRLVHGENVMVEYNALVAEMALGLLYFFDDAVHGFEPVFPFKKWEVEQKVQLNAHPRPASIEIPW